jgi:propanol-preferring alcohol dehydrogenase
MKAMLLKQTKPVTVNSNPLELTMISTPRIGDRELLLQVKACGVCHTELDEIEGRTPPTSLPMVLGHQVVGIIESMGKDVDKFQVGERVGVAWIYHACGKCAYCLRENENLCADFQATGRDVFGGYAEYIKVDQDFAYRIPPVFKNSEAAPLLCAGSIGYRSLILANIKDGQSLGLSGFGASGHLVLLMAKYLYPNSLIFVFSRNEAERNFAYELGATWCGGFEIEPPVQLERIIDTTPVWKPIVESLKNLAPGGRLVINAIRKEEKDITYLTKIKYENHLWMEKEIKSVANITRKDVSEFLELAAKIPLKPEYQEFALEDANKALEELKLGKIRGAKVLVVSS